jgi:hypothetical protein
VFIVTSRGQNVRLGGVEVLLAEKKQVLEFLESQRRAIESETASRQRELEAAEAALEKVRSEHNLFLTNRSYLTNADYIKAKADLDDILQKVENLKAAAEKWRTRDAELQTAASRAVQELQAAADREVQSARQAQTAGPRTDAAARQARANTAQTRASSASSAFTSLERVAKRIFQPPGGRSVRSSGAGLTSSVPPAGEIRELAEWRAFLELAPEGLRVNAEKLAEKQSEVASFEEKVRSIERAAVGESGQAVQAAESRVAAAKLKGGSPTAEAYLGSFRPSAVQQTHTDTDGMFSLTYPRDREFVLFVRADGAVRAGNSEKCYWLVNAPSGPGDLWLQLSNDNLARTDSEGRVQVLTTPPSQRPVRNSLPSGGVLSSVTPSSAIVPEPYSDQTPPSKSVDRHALSLGIKELNTLFYKYGDFVFVKWGATAIYYFQAKRVAYRFRSHMLSEAEVMNNFEYKADVFFFITGPNRQFKPKEQGWSAWTMTTEYAQDGELYGNAECLVCLKIQKQKGKDWEVTGENTLFKPLSRNEVEGLLKLAQRPSGSQ